MKPLYIGAAGVLVAIIVAYLYRVVAGPTKFDRIAGVNGVATKTILLLVLIGVLYDGLDMVVDIVIGYALLNFVAGLAAAKYLARGSPQP